MKTILFKGNTYPKFQSEGFAAKFAFPFAQQVCNGLGVDVGCMKPEWAFPNAIPVDIDLPGGFHALNLPYNSDGFDYIFSSHCLEHLDNWVTALDYWIERLKSGGILFLYLPSMDEQLYWQPWNNRKHIHYLTPEILARYFEANKHKFENVFISGSDLNCSFTIIAEKA
jgi:SAM-dependent methyltransferase